jgi:hypothetical protein
LIVRFTEKAPSNHKPKTPEIMKKTIVLLALLTFGLSLTSCDAVAEQDETAELYDTFSTDKDDENEEKKD